jgi:hypothetical protein
MPYLLKVTPAKDGKHKFNALFKLHTGKYKTVPFGAVGYSDMTQHGDPKRMERYLARHKANEDWTDMMSPGALSRWILWSAPSLEKGIENYKKAFGLVGGERPEKPYTEQDKREDDEIREYPLSDGDIRQLLPNLKILSYPELNDYSVIEDAFDDEGRSLILYLTENEHTGHWVCMIKKGTTIEYFDPYGKYRPDEEREWLSKHKLKQLDQYHPTLTELLARSRYKVLVNPYHFQKDKSNIATCGRHCCCRLAHKHLSLPAYKAMIDKSGLTPDDFVSAWSYRVLKR